MDHALALTVRVYNASRRRQADAARCVIVLASAAALILAGQPLPL
ncbi:MAG: hypothetical protein AAFZ11_01900 [Pseudomonadota bacterium]